MAPSFTANYDYPYFDRIAINAGVTDGVLEQIDALLLLPATHGAIGGYPGYNDREENDADGYSYDLDVSSSIRADEFIRIHATNNCIVNGPVSDYGHPPNNPDF